MLPGRPQTDRDLRRSRKVAHHRGALQRARDTGLHARCGIADRGREPLADVHLARLRYDDTGRDAQRRRLAAAVGSDERVHLTGTEIEVDAVEGAHGAVPDLDVGELEDVVGGVRRRDLEGDTAVVARCRGASGQPREQQRQAATDRAAQRERRNEQHRGQHPLRAQRVDACCCRHAVGRGWQRGKQGDADRRSPPGRSAADEDCDEQLQRQQRRVVGGCDYTDEDPRAGSGECRPPLHRRRAVHDGGAAPGHRVSRRVRDSSEALPSRAPTGRWRRDAPQARRWRTGGPR